MGMGMDIGRVGSMAYFCLTAWFIGASWLVRSHRPYLTMQCKGIQLCPLCLSVWVYLYLLLLGCLFDLLLRLTLAPCLFTFPDP